jgi:hypothetical protein
MTCEISIGGRIIRVSREVDLGAGSIVVMEHARWACGNTRVRSSEAGSHKRHLAMLVE